MTVVHEVAVGVRDTVVGGAVCSRVTRGPESGIVKRGFGSEVVMGRVRLVLAIVVAACGDSDAMPPVDAPMSPVCGNGAQEEGESCDDGNTIDGDGCSQYCGTCGDGIQQPDEDCDGEVGCTDLCLHVGQPVGQIVLADSSAVGLVRLGADAYALTRADGQYLVRRHVIGSDDGFAADVWVLPSTMTYAVGLAATGRHVLVAGQTMASEPFMTLIEIATGTVTPVVTADLGMIVGGLHGAPDGTFALAGTTGADAIQVTQWDPLTSAALSTATADVVGAEEGARTPVLVRDEGSVIVGVVTDDAPTRLPRSFLLAYVDGVEQWRVESRCIVRALAQADGDSFWAAGGGGDGTMLVQLSVLQRWDATGAMQYDETNMERVLDNEIDAVTGLAGSTRVAFAGGWGLAAFDGVQQMLLGPQAGAGFVSMGELRFGPGGWVRGVADFGDGIAAALTSPDPTGSVTVDLYLYE